MLVEKDLRVDGSPRVEQMIGTGQAPSSPINDGKAVVQQRKRQLAQNLTVEDGEGAWKSVEGRVDRVVESETRGDYLGGVLPVVSQEPVVRASSSLNKEKHVVVQVGGEEEPWVNRNVKGK
ncbi:hypothetical protein V6N13_072575 [Hibiscus sabdariffa]